MTGFLPEISAELSSERVAEVPKHPPQEMKPVVVLRPTPTLPSGVAFGLRPQSSAFQPPPLRPTASRSPGIPPMTLSTSLGLPPHLPHPARAWPGSGLPSVGLCEDITMPRTMSEDELAASTVGSLSGRREDVAGPMSGPGNQLARQISRDGMAGEDGMPRIGDQAQQQAMMQQQVRRSASPSFNTSIGYC